MHTIAEEIISTREVKESNIIFIDLKKRGFKSIKTPELLEETIEKLSSVEGVKYLL